MKVKSLSPVRLPVTPWTAAYQAPPSMDFPGESTGVGEEVIIACAPVSAGYICYPVGVGLDISGLI